MQNNLTKKPRSKVAVREKVADAQLHSTPPPALPLLCGSLESSPTPPLIGWPRIVSGPVAAAAAAEASSGAIPLGPAAAAAVQMDILANIFLRLNTSLMTTNRFLSGNLMFPINEDGSESGEVPPTPPPPPIRGRGAVFLPPPPPLRDYRGRFTMINGERKRTLPMVSAEPNGCMDSSKINRCGVLPPPKKKWIRHYLKEEPYSNGHLSPSSLVNQQQTSIISATAKHLQQHQQQQQGLQSQQQQQALSVSPKSDIISSHFLNNNNCKTNNTTITFVHNDKTHPIFTTNGSSPTAINGDINLAALSAAAALTSNQPIVINVTNNQTAANAFSANRLGQTNNATIRNSPPMGVASAVAAGTATNATVFRKKCIPLTPPPMSNKKTIESSRIRSLSLSSNKIPANGLIGSNGIVNGNSSNNTPAILQNHLHHHHHHQALAAAAAAAATATEDSSQSSLNLSSSGYLNGGSINSNVGSLNLSTSNGALNGISMVNGSTGGLLVAGGHLDHPIAGVASSAPTSSGVHQLHAAGTSRRRTISSNSNGSSCTSRAGTREVHNKLEKHRRAQLKECFEQLKSQLALKDEERKKTSNLAILGAALKHVMALKQKERELGQLVEQLAKEKINAQKKFNSLKRGLGSRIEHIDFSSISSDIEIGSIPIERVTEGLNDSISLSSGRGSTLYSSSSSLSSGSGGNTMSSPLGAGMQTAMPTALSPVISQSTSSSSSANSSNNCSPTSSNMMMMKSLTASPSSSSSLSTSSPSLMLSSSAAASPMITNICGNGLGTQPIPTTGSLAVTMPLSLTAKNISATSLTRGSPTPSTPSPSPSSSSGVSSSSSIHSSSPPIGGVKIVPNIPTNGVKFGAAHAGGVLTNVSTNGNTFVTSPVINITSHSENNGGISSSNSVYNATASGMPLSMNAVVAASISSSCSSSSPSAFFSSTSSTAPTITTVSHNNKEFNSIGGRNGLSRKTPASDSHSNNNDISHYNNNNNNNHQSNQHQHKLLDEGEQPAKVFKVFNGFALGSMDKTSTAQLQLSEVVGGGSLVVSPFLTSTQNGGSLRLVGATNSLATIELSSGPNNQTRTTTNGNFRGHSASPPNNGGAQLHKLLMSAVSGGNGGSDGGNNATNYVPAAELGRLPGGAEVNILPTATNGTTSLYRGNGKLAIVNNCISLKGTAVNDSSNSSNNNGRGGVHVANTSISQSTALASIAVSQGQQGSNFAQLIATSPQLAGKVNLSVGGQSLPLLGSQYLGSMKPMVVAVPNNSNQPTLSSSSSSVVAPHSSTTSTAIVTGTTNGNAL